MNKKKGILLLLVLVIVGIVIYFIANNISITKSEKDGYSNYTPQEEISDEQLRQTSITLYFLDKETNQLKSESQLIDSTELLKNPYKSIAQKLINGPTNTNLKSVFPENTRLIDASLTHNCVILNFSQDLLNFNTEEEKYNIINCLLNSLTQLNEVNSIKILINNEQNEKMGEEYCQIS